MAKWKEIPLGIPLWLDCRLKQKFDKMDALAALQETKQKECSQCGGKGNAAPFGRDIGELYGEWLACEDCNGSGKINIKEDW